MSKLLQEYGIEEDPRNRQCFKEAMSALGLFSVYTIVVVVAAAALWALDPEGRIFGLPTYLFWTGVVAPVALVVSVWAMTRFTYQDMPLDPDPDTADAAAQR
ncbi:DUF997 family protein [Mycobacterium sp. NAZ190054]|uniref:DUF997 family protein n=1 Tax=Mycobacterium sp. NAZ190054 TaxID=1747766 RepID=UPI0007924BD8|nr:DUF997 family protein [Mycobacterium sp. NAZ190054]KWX68487.1 hypothetical protein ASJ79_17580 [Mycobacterium sp. NAZ190054]